MVELAPFRCPVKCVFIFYVTGIEHILNAFALMSYYYLCFIEWVFICSKFSMQQLLLSEIWACVPAVAIETLGRKREREALTVLKVCVHGSCVRP